VAHRLIHPCAREILKRVQKSCQDADRTGDPFDKFFSVGLAGEIADRVLSAHLPPELQTTAIEPQAQPLAVEELPTEYEQPTLYRYLRELGDVVESIHARLGWANYTPPLLGTTWSGRYQALVLRSKQCTQQVIILERGLFHFLSSFLKLYLTVLPNRVAEDTVEYLLDRESVSAAITKKSAILGGLLSDLIRSYVIDGRVESFSLPPIAPHHAPLMETYLRATEILFVAHEYGHLQAGHYASAPPLKTRFSALGYDEYVIAQAEELEADRFALQTLVFDLRQRSVTVHSAVAAAVFFSYVPELVDEAVMLLATGGVTRRNYSKYPDAKTRMQYAIDTIVRATDMPHSEAVEHCVAHMNGIGQAFIAARGWLAAMHRHGLRPRREFE
jgi:hypothetical protein